LRDRDPSLKELDWDIKEPRPAHGKISMDDYEPPGWNIMFVCIMLLPVYHQLEKYIARFPKIKLGDVLVALQDMFRIDSLKVDYQNGNATETTMARCESMDGVKFVVQFWQTSDPDEYLLEIQRTGGDSMLFGQHRYAKRIVALVESQSHVAPTDQMPPVVTRTFDPLEYSEELAKHEQSQLDTLMKFCRVPPAAEKEAGSSMEIAAELLDSDRFDLVSLGLESCTSLTDTNKSGCTTATKAATTMLIGDGGASEKVAKVPPILISLAFTDRPHPKLHDSEANLTVFHSFAALTIVAQCVNVWELSSIEAFYKKVTVEQGIPVVKTLLEGVKNARNSIHVAYLSTHILAAFCRAVPSVRDEIRDNEDIVEIAKTVGSHSHAGLAQASHRLSQELAVGL